MHTNHSRLARATLGLSLAALGLLALATAAQSACVPPPSGLVAWWRGDGTASDSVGGANGTLYGGVTFAPGRVGQCFAFNGVNGAVNVPDVPALALTNSLTIECWLLVTNAPSGPGMVLFRGDTRSGLDPYYLVVMPVTSASATLDFIVMNQANMDAHVSSPMPMGTWTHVAATLDDGTGLTTLYTNAVVAAQITTTVRPLGPLDPNYHPGVGIGNHSSQPGPFNYAFRGLIDELSLYKRALSAAEVQGIYNAGSAGKCGAPGIPPSIVSQPASQSIFVGDTVSFTVTASGDSPLGYQWRSNGTNINGATGTSLSLNNVQPAQAGTYAVQVTNAYGSTNSANALLTVKALPPCVPSPSDLVAWWRGDGAASDSVGGANGTLYGGVTFAPGRVGQCFAFNGVNSAVNVPDVPALALTHSLTIEGWLFVTNPPSGVGMVIFRGDTRSGLDPYTMYVSPGAGGSAVLSFTLTGPSNNSFGFSSRMPTGAWTHVAATLDDATGLITLYTNAVVAVQTNTTVRPLGPLDPNYHPGVGIGNHSSQPAPFNYPFRGRIDELSLYSRALSATELQAIYVADRAGKCQEAPTILVQPATLAVTETATATFTVSAAGTPQLHYQWRFNGTNITAATSASLTLNNVEPAQAGNYLAVVSNAFGSVTSSNAVLAVNRLPVAQCANVIVSAGTNCQADASINHGSFDPDGDPITVRQVPPGPYPLGTNHVTLIVTDDKGASNSCSTLVIVLDRTPPVLVCAPNKRVEYGAAWSFDAPSATDNCGTATVTVVSTVTNALCGSSFVATRTWQATDASGNKGTCNQTVTVGDTTPPSLSCPGGKVLEFQDETGVVATFSVTATDAGSAVTLVVAPPSGSLFPIGVTPVQVRATDACSNSAQCSFTVTVLGAQGVKSNVLAQLTALRSSVILAQPFAQKFDNAIEHLADSLNPAYWTDQTHLLRKGGDTAMNEEKLAVSKLREIMDSKKCPVDPAILQGVIDRIVKCDRLLAVICIQDAVKAGLDARKIAEALAEVAKGDAEAVAGHYANAIEHYRNAWRHTLQLQLQVALNPDGSARVQFVGDSGKSYGIEVSTDMVHWVPLGTCKADGEGNVAYTDPNVTHQPLRFYRVVEQ